LASRSIRLFAWALLLVLGGSLATVATRMVAGRRAAKAKVLGAGRAQADAAAQDIQALLLSLESRVHGIAEDLESGRLRVAGLQARLSGALEGAPAGASRMGVLFQPYAGDLGRRLLAPYAERNSGRTRAFDFASSGDYTALAWYQYDLGQPCWNEPHQDPATGDLLVDYSEPVRLPGAAAVSGVVRIEVTLRDIQDLVASVAPGSSGYAFLLSSKGVFLANPIQARVREGQTLEGVGRRMKDPGRLRIARAAAEGRADLADSVSGVTGQATWMFLAPIRAAGWSLGTMIIKDEVVLDAPDLKRVVVRLVNLGMLAGATALFLLLGLPSPDRVRLGWFAVGSSCIVAAGTTLLWYFAYTIHLGPQNHEVEVMSKAGLKAFLDKYRTLGSGLRKVESTFVPTGLFIQKVEMTGGNAIRISGQVWQKFPKGFPAEAKGVVFPEASSCEMEKGFTKEVGGALVAVQPFRGVFPMPAGSTVNYPFDRTSVRLRIWSRLIYSNVVLVPDLEAYTLLAPASLPGIDKGLSLAGWHLGQSHFSFLIQTYNTNFGIPDYTGQQDSPELLFTFTLKRNFTTPFIATFLPIFVVAGLLFALVATTTVVKERVAAFGYNVINILRALTSLFFPVVIAQVNLRNHILTEGLLIVEYYYFVIYGLILLAAANSMAVALWDKGFHQEGDNRLPKLLFWPVLCTAFYLISTLYLL